jgi:hypothetical protein
MYNYILFANKRYKVIFLFFIISLLALFSGFRFETGIDYNNYLLLYNNSGYSSSEYLYWFISILHKEIFDSFRLFVFMSSFILIFMKVYLLSKLSDNIFLTIFIFICISYIHVDMGLLRNSFSFSFFILSMYYYINNKRWMSYFYFVVAFFFHHAVIFMLFVYFVNKYRTVSSLYLYLILISLIISYSGVLTGAIELIANSFSYFPYISWKINHYLLSDHYQNEGLSFYTVRFTFIALLFYFYREKIKNNFFIKIYMIGTVLILLAGFNIQIYARIGLFLVFFEMLLMPNFVMLFKGWERILLFYFIILFYGIMFARTSYIFRINEVSFF